MDEEYSLDLLLQAMTVDALNTLVWFQSEDGQKGRNRPPSVMETLLGKESHNNNDILSFSSAAEFERERERRINGN